MTATSDTPTNATPELVLLAQVLTEIRAFRVEVVRLAALIESSKSQPAAAPKPRPMYPSMTGPVPGEGW